VNYTVLEGSPTMEYFKNMAGAEEELYRKWKVKIFEWRNSRVEPENSGIVRRDKKDCKRNLKGVTGYVR